MDTFKQKYVNSSGGKNNRRSDGDGGGDQGGSGDRFLRSGSYPGPYSSITVFTAVPLTSLTPTPAIPVNTTPAPPTGTTATDITSTDTTPTETTPSDTTSIDLIKYKMLSGGLIEDSQEQLAQKVEMSKRKKNPDQEYKQTTWLYEDNTDVGIYTQKQKQPNMYKYLPLSNTQFEQEHLYSKKLNNKYNELQTAKSLLLSKLGLNSYYE